MVIVKGRSISNLWPNYFQVMFFFYLSGFRVLILLHPWSHPLQATSQSDLENWVTALHSANAALLARSHCAADTLRLLQRRTRSLLQHIDADGRMRKMAELQLSVIREPRSRRAVESQVSG